MQAFRLRRDGNAMAIEQGAAAADVKIRTSRRDWMGLLLLLGLFLYNAATAQVTHEPGLSRVWLVLVVVLAGEALWIRSFGVDLTQASVNVRGVRRRSIPWSEVQAVTQYQRLGCRGVRLILENGSSFSLRAPTTLWDYGLAGYERDFHRIGQWWLAHRGASWRPVRPEAPWPAAQG